MGGGSTRGGARTDARTGARTGGMGGARTGGISHLHRCILAPVKIVKHTCEGDKTGRARNVRAHVILLFARVHGTLDFVTKPPGRKSKLNKGGG